MCECWILTKKNLDISLIMNSKNYFSIKLHPEVYFYTWSIKFSDVPIYLSSAERLYIIIKQ